VATLHLQLVMHLSSGHRLQHISERADNFASVSAALEQHGMADGLRLKIEAGSNACFTKHRGALSASTDSTAPGAQSWGDWKA
jgi:hypothetical protein